IGLLDSSCFHVDFSMTQQMKLGTCPGRRNVEQPHAFICGLGSTNFPDIGICGIAVGSTLFDRRQKKPGVFRSIDVFQQQKQSWSIRLRISAKAWKNDCVELESLGLVNREQLKSAIRLCIGACEESVNIVEKFLRIPEVHTGCRGLEKIQIGCRI